MSIPFNTTLVAISRVVESTDTDGYDPTPPAPIAVTSGIRAVVTLPSGRTTLVGGERIVYDAQLYCDPTDLQADDLVTETAGNVWRVLNVRSIAAFGLDHLVADLRIVEGATE